MLNEPIEVTLKVTGVLEQLDIPYLIGGSLASTLYGMVRSTQDSDIVAEMHVEHVQACISALQGEFFIVDVFIPLPRPFQKSQLSRARKQTFALETEVSAKFATPEDTILSKLEWYRMGGEASDRQWRDILGVMKTRAGELDIDYLLKWAGELNISDLLARALSEVG